MVDDALVEQALAEAPLLTPAAARFLLEDATQRGRAGADHVLDAALFAAGRGFEDMEQSARDEAGRLVSRVWGAGSASDARTMQTFVQHARTGDPAATEVVDAGRARFAEGVRGLPERERARLRELFSQAVIAGIRRQRAAEERVRNASVLPPVELGAAADGSSPAEAANAVPSLRAAMSVPPGGWTDQRRESRGPSTGKGEAYWRQRAASARAAVAAAEERVRQLEARLSQTGAPYLPMGPRAAACQEGVTPGMNVGVSLRDRARVTKTCDATALQADQADRIRTQLDAAREAVKRAQKRLDDLADEARREGALPGWLR